MKCQPSFVSEFTLEENKIDKGCNLQPFFDGDLNNSTFELINFVKNREI